MKRFFHIDFLRAVSILIVIIIHILQFNLDNLFNRFFWNYLNFVVVSFIFCSAYVLEVSYGHKLNSFNKIIVWWKKRIVRLLIPFYIYLVVHYLFWNLWPNFFNGFDLKNNFNYLKDSILLIGGVSANWLPLLFIELALIFPLLKRVKKNIWLFTGYLFFSLIITGLYTGATIIGLSLFSYYRLAMIVPYSLVALLAMSLAGKDNFKKYLMVISICSAGFFILLIFWPGLGKIRIYSQKYPPNFYYFFYGLAMTGITILLSYLRIFKIKIIKNFVLFSSTQAYNLFFASYIVNDFIQKQRQYNSLINYVVLQLLLVVFLSYLVVYILKLLKSNFD